ncbi:MAG: hypothetical protein RL062_281 [Bacteroidota bacterium]|jgi:geranylgeranyl diphosphate synthase type II
MGDNSMKSLVELQQIISQDLEGFYTENANDPLFHPIHYLLKIGGKRMRPALVLLANQMLNGNIDDARSAALAVEVFHNFTLMHDDIMDEAPLRRGEITVHQKWNNNTAILSGDAMMIEAYRLLCLSPQGQLRQLMTVFNEVALGVCKGQELDMSFENRSDVSHDEYVEMIRLKTAVLLGGALQLGGIIANADIETQNHLFKIGEELGLSFQLMDDYLDAFGDPTKFGKRVGGDIVSDKKTYLRILLQERASEYDLQVIHSNFNNDEEKIETIKNLMTAYQVDQDILSLKTKYSDSALAHLTAISCPEENKNELRRIIHQLAERES